jgi:hypothetical protein
MVPIREVRRAILPTPIFGEDTRLFVAWLAVSDKFHGVDPSSLVSVDRGGDALVNQFSKHIFGYSKRIVDVLLAVSIADTALLARHREVVHTPLDQSASVACIKLEIVQF